MIPMTVCPAGQRGITQPKGRFLPLLGASDRRGNHPEAPGLRLFAGRQGIGAFAILATWTAPTERPATCIRQGFSGSAYVGMEPDDRSWQLAISFIAAWRGTGAGRDPSAVAHRLAEVTADGNATTIEQAVLGLTTLGNMFLELYADCAGSSADAVLREASSINWDEPC
jgi:hypothetical protein